MKRLLKLAAVVALSVGLVEGARGAAVFEVKREAARDAAAAVRAGAVSRAAHADVRADPRRPSRLDARALPLGDRPDDERLAQAKRT